MREIKFRAWNKRDKIMFVNVHNVYDACEWKTSTGECKDLFVSSFGYLLDNDDFIVMQYTGMKDVDGKEIYEGDNIAVNHGDIIKEVVFGKIEYSTHCHGADDIHHYTGWLTEDGFGFRQPLRNAHYYKIIGNVYENPKQIMECGGSNA